MHDYRLKLSTHVDAPRVARVFARGVLEGLEVSDDARTAVVLMVSDATTDSVRSGHAVTVTGTLVADGCLLTVEGSDLAPPAVRSMPAGLSVESDDRLLEIRIGPT